MSATNEQPPKMVAYEELRAVRFECSTLKSELAATKARLSQVREALVEVLPLAKAHLMRRFGKDTLPVAVREALAALDAPAGDTGGKESV